MFKKFDQVDKKFKIIAIVLFALLTLASVVGGIVVICRGADGGWGEITVTSGVFIVLLGWLIARLAVLPLASFCSKGESGNLLKTITIIFFILLVLAGFIGGIVMVSIASDHYSSNEGLFWAGILTVLFGWIGAVIVTAPLFAFAGLVQNVAAIREKLCESKNDD